MYHKWSIEIAVDTSQNEYMENVLVAAIVLTDLPWLS